MHKKIVAGGPDALVVLENHNDAKVQIKERGALSQRLAFANYRASLSKHISGKRISFELHRHFCSVIKQVRNFSVSGPRRVLAECALF